MEIKPTRDRLLAAQGGKCAICQRPIDRVKEIAVLDHCHDSGAVRGTLHHSCNAVLGKIENSYKMFGMGNHLFAFLSGVAGYLMRHRSNQTGLIHPTHRTEAEKKLAKAKKAKLARAKKKKEASA